MKYKKKSRLIAAVMTIALIFTMMPMMAFAEDEMNEYSFYFKKPSSSNLQYNSVQNAMRDRFANEAGEEASATENNGTFTVKVNCKDVITYKDLLGEEGVLRKIYSGGVQTPDNYIGVGTKPSPDDYTNEAEFVSECNSDTPIPITGAKFYTLTMKMISHVDLTLETPSCGTVIAFDGDSLTVSDFPKFTAVGEAHFSIPEGIPAGGNVFSPKSIWLKDPEELFPLEDTMVGDNTYYALTALIPDFGYKFSDNMPADHITVNGEPATIVFPIGGTHIDVFASVDVVHDFDEGIVTKKPTATEEGIRTFTCKGGCGTTQEESIPKIEPTPTPDPSDGDDPTPAPTPDPSSGDDPTPAPTPAPDNMGKDGTAVGPGASAAVAEKAIMSAASDEGPKGTKYAPLKLKSTKQTKTSVKLTWSKSNKAKKYVVYGNLCGKNYKMKELGSTTKATKNITKIAGKKLKKGKYYKFIIVALDKNNKVVSTSKVVHVATKGGKAGNHKSVTVKKTVISKAKKIKKGKSLKLNAKAVKASKLTVKKHRAVSYESSNPKIATVSKKGVVKGKKKGTCYIYAYAQNGVARKIKVVIK